MNITIMKHGRLTLAVIVVFLFLSAVSAHAVIDGITGPTFTFTAKSGHITTPDGGVVYIWGYADGTGTVQYPGPTLIVQQGELVTITLNAAPAAEPYIGGENDEEARKTEASNTLIVGGIVAAATTIVPRSKCSCTARAIRIWPGRCS